MGIQGDDAHQLLVRFIALGDDSRNEFLALLACRYNEAVLIRMVNTMPPDHQKKFSTYVHKHLIKDWLPPLVDRAIELSEKHADMPAQNRRELMRDDLNKLYERLTDTIHEYEKQKINKPRGRRAIAKAKKHLEICRLWHLDPERYTQGKLAKKFGYKSSSSIRAIIEKEKDVTRFLAEQGAL
jgi:hypothetical protein